MLDDGCHLTTDTFTAPVGKPPTPTAPNGSVMITAPGYQSHANGVFVGAVMLFMSSVASRRGSRPAS